MEFSARLCDVEQHNGCGLTIEGREQATWMYCMYVRLGLAFKQSDL